MLNSEPKFEISNGQAVSTPSKFHVVGPNRSLNQSMRFFLESVVKVQCTSEQCVPPGAIIYDSAIDMRAIYLFDALGWNEAAIEAPFFKQAQTHTGEPGIVLFNLDANVRVEKFIGHAAIRGIFYRHDSKSVFLNGLQAIINGRKWFTGHSTPAPVANRRELPDLPEQEWRSLSPREKEILQLVAAGMNNSEIAAEVGISIHTVKTHVYHIFKKIEVPNRLQAALWAAANLG